MGAGLVGRAVELARQRLVENVVDQRALARPADAGDRHQAAERDLHVHGLEVVGTGAANHDLALGFLTAGRRRDDAVAAGEVGAGQRTVAVADQVRRRALENHLPTQLAGAGTKVHDIVGRANGFFVVLHHHHRVAEIAQSAQRRQQLPVVALVQADRGLVQDVQHTGEVRANLRRETNALPLPTRQGSRRTRERQVADADVVQEAQPIANLLQDTRGDDRLAPLQLDGVEHGEGARHGQVHVIGHRLALEGDRLAFRPQAVALADRTLTQGAIRIELFLHRPRALFKAAPQVGNHAFEIAAERFGRHQLFLGGLGGFGGLGGCGGTEVPPSWHAARPQQDQVAVLLRQLAEWHLRINAVVRRDRQHRIGNQLAIAASPRRNGAGRQRQRFVRHNAMRVEVPGRAQALARLAGAVW